jgi:hypothetical protein
MLSRASSRSLICRRVAVSSVSIMSPLTPVGEVAFASQCDSWYPIAASRRQSMPPPPGLECGRAGGSVQMRSISVTASIVIRRVAWP